MTAPKTPNKSKPNSFGKLLPEIWHSIIAHSLQPLPAPAVDPRMSSCRQGDLATLMRVSPGINALAANSLYRRVITDDFDLLVHGIASGPAAKGIPSKRDLLGKITSLHLEYSDKKAEPTYRWLLETGDWMRVGGSHESTQLSTAVACEQDRVRINRAINAINATSSGFMLFSRVGKVSFGAYLGGQSAIWAQALSSQESPMTASRFYWLLALPTVQHVCLRPSLGPLSPPTYYTSKPETAPAWTVHFSVDSITMPVLVNFPALWILERPVCDLDDDYLDEAGRLVHWEDVADRVIGLLEGQKTAREKIRQTFPLHAKLLIDIKASSPTQHLSDPPPDRLWEGPTTSFAPQRTVTKYVEQAEKWVHDNMGWSSEDKITWKGLYDVDPCVACGWECPEAAW